MNLLIVAAVVVLTVKCRRRVFVAPCISILD